MKLNDSFVLRNIMGVYLLVPVRKNDITMSAIEVNQTVVNIISNAQFARDVFELAALVSDDYVDMTDEQMTDLTEFICSLENQGILRSDQ